MKVALLCRKFLVLHAIGSVILSGPLRASEPVRSEVKAQAIKPLDVKLDKKAGFTGQLVNASGKPQSRAVVELRRDNEVVETIRTDKEGRFAFAGLRTVSMKSRRPTRPDSTAFGQIASLHLRRSMKCCWCREMWYAGSKRCLDPELACTTAKR